MAITLNSRMPDEGPGVYYDEGFRQLIEDHLEYLRQHPLTEVIDIDPQTAYKGHGDLISVLQDYGVERRLHWIILRVNGYSSPMEYRQDHLLLKVPSTEVIDGLMRTFRVNRKLAKKSQAA